MHSRKNGRLRRGNEKLVNIPQGKAEDYGREGENVKSAVEKGAGLRRKMRKHQIPRRKRREPTAGNEKMSNLL